MDNFKLEKVSVRLTRDAPIMSGTPITTPEEAVRTVGHDMCELDREVVCIINLKADGTPINCTFASMGAVDKSIAHPRELLKATILSNAANMILMHNHPSGSLEPSMEDTLLTDRMVKVCDLVGVPLLDHIIVGGDDSQYFSFREKDKLPVSNLRYELKTDYKDIEFNVPMAAESRTYSDNRRNAKVIAVCNQKSRSGKTTTVVNMGMGFAREGYKVLMVDSDPKADMTASLGWSDTDGIENSLATAMESVTRNQSVDFNSLILSHPEGIDVIPSNLDLSFLESRLVTEMGREQIMRMLLKEVRDKYDYIIIDCQSSLGMIIINALTAADSVIIPVQDEQLKGMSQLLQTINRVRVFSNTDLKVEGALIINSSSRTAEMIRSAFGKYVKVFDTKIPVEETSYAYRNLVKEVIANDRESGVHFLESGAEGF